MKELTNNDAHVMPKLAQTLHDNQGLARRMESSTTLSPERNFWISSSRWGNVFWPIRTVFDAVSRSQNAFIEHAEFSKNLYGTSIQAVKDVATQGRQCILDIDSQGVKLIKANHPSLNPVFIFLSPPSLSALKDRLTGRGTESEASLTNRLAASTAEIEYARQSGSYDAVVVNDNLDKAYSRLKLCIVEDRLSEVGCTVPEMSETPKQVAHDAVQS